MRNLALILSIGFVAAQTAPQAATDVPPGVKPKVLLLIFDPPVASEGNKRLHEVMHWSDPEWNSKEYAADLKECSGERSIDRVV